MRLRRTGGELFSAASTSLSSPARPAALRRSFAPGGPAGRLPPVPPKFRPLSSPVLPSPSWPCPCPSRPAPGRPVGRSRAFARLFPRSPASVRLGRSSPNQDRVGRGGLGTALALIRDARARPHAPLTLRRALALWPRPWLPRGRGPAGGSRPRTPRSSRAASRRAPFGEERGRWASWARRVWARAVRGRVRPGRCLRTEPSRGRTATHLAWEGKRGEVPGAGFAWSRRRGRGRWSRAAPQGTG